MAQRFGPTQVLEWFQSFAERVDTLRPIESDAEREHRLEEARRRLGFELWRARVLLSFGLAVIAVVLAACLFVLLVPRYSDAQRQWAVPVLTSILTSAATAALAYKAGTAEK